MFFGTKKGLLILKNHWILRQSATERLLQIPISVTETKVLCKCYAQPATTRRRAQTRPRIRGRFCHRGTNNWRLREMGQSSRRAAGEKADRFVLSSATKLPPDSGPGADPHESARRHSRDRTRKPHYTSRVITSQVFPRSLDIQLTT